MVLTLPLLLACGPPARPIDSVRVSTDTGPVSWAPLAWTDCALALDVGSLTPLDDRMVFRPAVLGDRAWFTMSGDIPEQAIGLASLSQPGVLSEPALFLTGASLGTQDASSPAPVVGPDGGVALFFDAWSAGELGLWRCDLDPVGQPDRCEGVLATGTHGALDAGGAQIPTVVVDPDGLWRLWYTGLDAGGVRHILASTSPDGWVWEPPTLAVDVGSAGAWDATSVYSAFVWRDGPLWRMLYAGRSEHEGYQVKRLIEAWSDDAETWTDHTMTLDLGCVGAEDAWRVDSPWVVPEGGGWRLYYDGFDDPLTDVGTRRVLSAVSEP